MAEALAAFHFPDDLWARLIYDLVDLRPVGGAADREPRRRPRPDLLRAGRQLRHREPPPDDRRRPRIGSSARPASSSCSSRIWSIAGRRRRADEARAAPPAARPNGAEPRPAEPRTAPTRAGPDERRRRGPLPARILIPVANPATAEELIRLGAALLDPRAGELTALGIVEVPEGMPLSEGATRARHARRLLQRVLDFAPDGTTIHPIVRIGRHAAEGIIEASAEQEADLIIFGWGGKAPAGREGGSVISPTIDEVVRDAPADIAVVKQRGSKDIRRIVVPVRGGPHAELAVRYADAIARRTDATSASSTSSRPASRSRSGPRPSTPSPSSSASTSRAAARGSSARRRTSGTRSSRRPSGPTSS